MPAAACQLANEPASPEQLARIRKLEEENALLSGDDARLRRLFARSRDLQAEFGGDVESYLAYLKADRAGLVR